MDSVYFLISSFDPLPRFYLPGACFQDEDLILGNGGYDKFRTVRKTHIQTGQDGSYIVVNSSGDEAVIGTDFNGYSKLFLYQHTGGWILSNSLLEAARFAANKGLPVTIDESHLSSFFIEGSFGTQLTSLRTSVREIRLVPSTSEVVIARSSSGSLVKLRPTSAIAKIEQLGRRYDEALREYLRLWVGRMATLLQSDLFLQSELTGGQDSRAVLALMLAASNHVGHDSIQRVRFTSNPAAPADYAIASQIAERFRLRFIDENQDRRSPVVSALSESYQKWKSLCLGVYTPVYFSGRRPTPTAITLGGSGGEGYRRFYSNITLERFVESRRKFIPSSAWFKKLKRDILEDIEFLHQGAEASLDPMVIHYRNFRDRCHGGRTSQYTYPLAPLGSAVLRWASTLCPPEQFERRQVSADILLNAARELALMPYDKPSKAFDARHSAELLDADNAIRSARLDGKVFASEPLTRRDEDFSIRNAVRMLQEDFLTHYEPMRGSGYFPHHYIEKARATLEEAVRNGRFSHAVEGCPVSHVILAGELSRLSGRNPSRPPGWLATLTSAGFRDGR